MFQNNFEDKKRFIAKKAGKIFVKKGYSHTSLQDIAREINISKAAIYHYFKSKDEILYSIINYETDDFFRVLESCAKDSKAKKLSPEKTLRAFIIAFATFLKKENVLPLIVLRERHQLTGRYKKLLRNLEQTIFWRVREEIKRVPQIKKNYDINVISFLIISMTYWMGYWIKEKGKLSLEELINQNIDIIFYGMLRK